MSFSLYGLGFGYTFSVGFLGLLLFWGFGGLEAWFATYLDNFTDAARRHGFWGSGVRVALIQRYEANKLVWARLSFKRFANSDLVFLFRDCFKGVS